MMQHKNAGETSVRPHCWLCGTPTLELLRPGNLHEILTAEDFRITDSNYGRTADIFRCTSCGFLECPAIPDVLSFCKEMDDSECDATRAERVLQAKQLLKRVAV